MAVLAEEKTGVEGSARFGIIRPPEPSLPEPRVLSRSGDSSAVRSLQTLEETSCEKMPFFRFDQVRVRRWLSSEFPTRITSLLESVRQIFETSPAPALLGYVSKLFIGAP